MWPIFNFEYYKIRNMKIFFPVILICIFSLFGFLSTFGQSFSDSLSINVEAIPINNNSAIQLSWNANISSNQYLIYKKNYGATSWGNPIATLSSSAQNYIDNTITSGTLIEYKVVRDANTDGTGYVLTGLKTELNGNKGKLILIVDDYFNITLNAEITELINDIEADGWFVYRQDVNRLSTSTSVKTIIQNLYNSDSQYFKSVFLLGHVPVPYSGNINPDGHPDHKGAWPADVYYADMNGTWNDLTINSAVATDPRNHNLPGDGKWDRNTLPSNVELEIARVDFYNLPGFTSSETDLMQIYLNKLHAFKTFGYVPGNSCLIEDNFQSMPEGFSASAKSDFSSLTGISNVTIADFSLLSNQDYLWSYGTGPGTFTDAAGIVSSSDFVNNDYNSTFTLLFGSYFGDWDSQNNLLRSALGSGRILASAWSGRPFLHYHPMAMGETIGTCIKLSQNNTGTYFLSTLNNFSQWIHIAQLGDPTLRMNYLPQPSNLFLSSNNDGSITLNWNAASNVLGYHVFRREANEESWTKLTLNYETTTSFNDTNIPVSGSYYYLVRSVDSTQTGSGKFLNMSLGIMETATSTVGIDEIKNEIIISPNPANDFITISNFENNISFSIYDLTGKIVMTGNTHENNLIEIKNWNQGVYILKTDYFSYKFIKL